MTKKRQRNVKTPTPSVKEAEGTKNNKISISKKSNFVNRLTWLLIGAILAAFLSVGVPRIYDAFQMKHPDTYVFLVGQENSYTEAQIKTEAPCRAKINIIPIQFPKGISSVSETELPIKFFEWTYPENTKLYTIAVENRGSGIERNIMIDISFTPSIIQSLEISSTNRINLNRGGQGSTRAIFEIDELLPHELQDVEIVVNGINSPVFEVWSEERESIGMVFVLDVVIEPDKEYTECIYPELTILGHDVTFTTNLVSFYVSVENTGTAPIERGEVLIEFYDDYRKENRSGVLAFENLSPGALQTKVANFDAVLQGNGYLYYNLVVGDVK